MIKLIFRNLFAKPINAIIIILTIAMSVSLMYCVLSFGNTIKNSLTEQYSIKNGASDIVIKSSSVKGSNLISLEGLEDEENIEWAIGSLSFYSSYKSENNEIIELRGFKKEQMEYLHNIDLVSKSFSEIPQILEDQIIISNSFAKANNIKVNDKIELSILGTYYNFYIGGIASDNGYFKDNSKTIIAVDTYLSSKLGWPFGYIYNQIFIKSTNSDALYNSLLKNPKYQSASIDYAIDQEHIKRNSSLYTALFDLTGSILILLAILIVTKLFGLQYKQKSREIIQLKTIGSTTKQLVFMMLNERLILGILGSALGGIASGIILNNIINATFGNSISSYSISNLAISIATILTFTLITGLVPIYNNTKCSIRSSMAQSQNNVYKLYPKFITAICIIFIISLIIEFSIKSSVRGIFGFFNLFLLILICVSIVPLIMRGTSKLLYHFKTSSARLASITLRSESSLMLSAQVLVIGVIVCILLSNGLNIATSYWKDYKNYTSDQIVVANVGSFKNERINEFADLDNVTNIYPLMQDNCYIEYNNKTQERLFLCGTDGNDIKNIYNLDFITDLSTIENALNNTDKNYIVLSGMYKYVKGYKIGEKVILTYKNKSEEYEIAGFCHTLNKNGEIAFINRSNFTENLGGLDYNTLFIKTNEPKKLINTIHDTLGKDGVEVFTMSEIAFNEEKFALNVGDFYEKLFILIMVMVLFSIVCNISSAKFTRQREFSQYLLLGMTNKKLLIQNIIESMATGIPTVLIGFGASALIMRFLLDSAILLNYYNPYSFNIKNSLLIITVFLVVYFLNPIVLWLIKKYQINSSIYKNL